MDFIVLGIVGLFLISSVGVCIHFRVQIKDLSSNLHNRISAMVGNYARKEELVMMRNYIDLLGIDFAKKYKKEIEMVRKVKFPEATEVYIDSIQNVQFRQHNITIGYMELKKVLEEAKEIEKITKACCPKKGVTMSDKIQKLKAEVKVLRSGHEYINDEAAPAMHEFSGIEFKMVSRARESLIKADEIRGNDD